MSSEPPRKKRKLDEPEELEPQEIKDRKLPDQKNWSKLQKSRQKYTPQIPDIFKVKQGETLGLPELQEITSIEENNDKEIRDIFPNTVSIRGLHLGKPQNKSKGKPLRVGIVFSGGQAAGGHNVVAGLYRYLKLRNPESKLFGFIKGPIGIMKGNYIEITQKIVETFINQGGFMMIDTGRDKIKKEEEFRASKTVVEKMKLDGLIIAGGDDSNTNGALLGEYFRQHNVKCNVIGAPKTIDGDLKNQYIETSFGFDSATKVYSSLIGNIGSDLVSAKKYYHFVRLMGRSASHITVECALQTHPNVCIVGEEVKAKKQTLKTITEFVCDVICQRASHGKDYGLVLVPEGLVEFIPEVSVLLGELNDILGTHPEIKNEEIPPKLSPACRALFDYLPEKIREEFLLERDPHGNVQVSKIETERLLIGTVEEELKKRKGNGKYVGKFSAISHFFGYEGRSVLPSNFDCNYCYAIGHAAGALIEHNKTGLVAVAQSLKDHPGKWKVGGMPVSIMLHLEKRSGKNVPVIEKALVKLDKKVYKSLVEYREKWAEGDDYRNPGPIQFEGPSANDVNFTLLLEHSDYKFRV